MKNGLSIIAVVMSLALLAEVYHRISAVQKQGVSVQDSKSIMNFPLPQWSIPIQSNLSIVSNSQVTASMIETESWAGQMTTLLLRARRLGEKQSQPLLLIIGEQRYDIVGERGVFRRYFSFVIPKKAWKISIISPKNGPDVVVEKLELQQGKEKRSLLWERP